MSSFYLSGLIKFWGFIVSSKQRAKRLEVLIGSYKSCLLLFSGLADIY